MVNTISSDIVKTNQPIVTEKDTLPQKSALTTAQTVDENEVIAEKEVSAEDSTKLQYFQEVKENLEILNRTIDLAVSQTEVSQDLSLARQLALNSVTNMLSSMDTVALTDEEKSILEQTGQEMEAILQSTEVQLDANDQQMVEELLAATDQDLVEVTPVATGQTMAAALPEATEDISPFLTTTSSTLDTEAYRTSGDNIICNKLAELLHKADEEYLQIYEYASEQRAKVQELLAGFQQIIPQYISTFTTGDDKGNINLNYTLIRKFEELGLVSLVTDGNYLKATGRGMYSLFTIYPPNLDLDYFTPWQDNNPPLPNTPEGKAEAEYWASQFPGSKVEYYYKKEDGGLERVIDGYFVTMDATPLVNIYNSLKSIYNAYGKGVSPTTFQTWQTGFNSEVESFKTTTQEFSQGYNNANSTFSTLAKLLTASVDSLYESLTSYLRF